MRFLKWVPIVGFCAVSFLPASAAADSHLKKIINIKSGLCLDATSEGGVVQQSECKKELQAQLWEFKGEQIINGYWKKECLDVYVVKEYPLLNTVQTNPCDSNKKAQNWEVEKNGEIQNDYTGQCLVAPGDRNLGPVKALRCESHGDFEKWKIVEVK